MHGIETAISSHGKATEKCKKLKVYSITYAILFEKVLLLLSKIDYEAANGNFSPPFNCVVLIHGKKR